MSMFGLPFREPTEEEVREYNEAVSRQRMENDETLHTVYRVIEEFNEEQLMSVRRVIYGINNAEIPEAVAQYWIGVITHRLAVGFDQCCAHSVNHALEVLEPPAQADSGSDERTRQVAAAIEPLLDDRGSGLPPEDLPPEGDDGDEHDPGDDACICGAQRRYHINWGGVCLATRCDGFVKAPV